MQLKKTVTQFWDMAYFPVVSNYYLSNWILCNLFCRFPHFNYQSIAIAILISAMLLINRLSLDSCLQLHTIHPSHYAPNRTFHSASGQVSYAVGGDREWFPSMFPAWHYKVQSLLFSAISLFLEYSTSAITIFMVTFPINWEISFA